MSKFPIVCSIIAVSLLSASPALSQKKCPKGYVDRGVGTCLPDPSYHSSSANMPIRSFSCTAGVNPNPPGRLSTRIAAKTQAEAVGRFDEMVRDANLQAWTPTTCIESCAFTTCGESKGDSGSGGGDKGKRIAAKSATNVYPSNDGKSKKLCTMDVGDTGIFMERKPGEPNWVHLANINGKCGRTGWVWDGGSLDF